jgi:hypothetical protein
MQCAIPAFDGLFPEPYNSSILKLLFLCAHWHGLAKLRSHTDLTLDVFEGVTIKTGAAFRHFANNICVNFDTRELAREESQRKRRQAKRKDRTQDAPPLADAQPNLNSTNDRLPDTSTPLRPSNDTPIAPPHTAPTSAASLPSNVATVPTAFHSTTSESFPREIATGTTVEGTLQV